MAHDDSTEERRDRSSGQKRKRLFHLPEGTKITFEGFGGRTEIDPDSPEGDLAVLGLIACIVFQAVLVLLMVVDSSGGIQTVTALVMAAAFAVIIALVISSLLGSGRETSTALLRTFCVLLLVAIVLGIVQNRDDPTQVALGILGIVVGVLALRRLGT